MYVVEQSHFLDDNVHVQAFGLTTVFT